MNKGLINIVKDTKAYRQLVEKSGNSRYHIGITNIDESLKHIYMLSQLEDDNLLCLCENELAGERLTAKLNALSPSTAIFISSEPIHYYFLDSHSREITDRRINSIHEVLFHSGKIVIAPFETLFKKLIVPEEYTSFYTNIEVGKIIGMDYLIERLIKAGYERCELVENKGQFSVRGGIIDLFNIIDKNPIQIEFFDDEVDSIRIFDVSTQRSTEKIERAQVSPAKEILFSPKKLEAIYKGVKKNLEKYDVEKKDDRQKNICGLLEGYINGDVKKQEGLIPYYKGELCSLYKYFNKDNIFFMDDGNKFFDQYTVFLGQIKEDYESLLEKGEILPNFFERFYTYDHIANFFQGVKTIDFQNLHKHFTYIKPDSTIDVNSKEVYSFYGKIPAFIDQLAQWKKDEYTVIILAYDTVRGESIKEMLLNYNILGYITTRDNIINRKVNILIGEIDQGFILYEDRYVVLDERNIFKSKSTRKKSKGSKGRQIESFTQLNIGDYIVHDTHGIGVYMGIEQIAVEGVKKDYLHLKYAKGDKLFIPVDQMESVQVFIGFGDKRPKINKLGSIEWKKTKQSTKESVSDMAKDLIEIYAQRRQVKGYAFSPDNTWTAEFDEKFPYEETEDQLQAIGEVKKDMENPVPMDRLICGDVGYGKTEVAIRAAFKCVMDNKQVAVLVPTTILAQQHYNSFLQRFEDYPIRIEMLSRFRSKKQQQQIVSELNKKQVDIVIGTHRLLSKDVVFGDLGLLVIDEEQRFGVKHKEKIKELKTNIDVLALSATPIPRTLHMSLIGARDMSILNEPPHNRTPVQTYIMEYNEIFIRDAISKELARGGQTYYVYNKVYNIDTIVAKVAKMVPEARIAVAHGQMSETKLESVMIDFMEREYDILICTTIIESGLDIPNVNTIIIEDADHMGLSQLYQLRGRVGRSDRLSYAYITYKKDKTLSEISEKRLKAIKDFTEFGSGFKIAMRDLEIRGAGNILGSRQHGHLATVGYDMYCKLLDEAVKEIKGEKVETSINTVIEIDVDGFIPDYYVKSEKQKYELYKKIIGIESQEELYQVEEDIEDRYGDLPKSVQNLLYVSFIKKLAAEIGISKIKGKETNITFTFEKNQFLNHQQIKELLKAFTIQFSLDDIGETSLLLKNTKKNQDLLFGVKDFLSKIKSTQNVVN